jgi:uncharacterized protein YdbL (DUF1318 family)
MKRYITFLFIALLLCAQTVFALDLQTAKAQGLVGETPAGYLAAVQNGNSEVVQLVQSINAQRKQYYQEIAQRNNTPLQAVEQLAGKKAIEKTPAGQFIRVNGAWLKK